MKKTTGLRLRKNSFSIHLPGGIPLPRELFIKERTPVFHSKRRLHHLQLDNNRIKPVVTVDFGKYSYNPTQLNEEPHAPATRNKVLSIINVKEIRSNLFFNTNKIGLFVYNKTRHQIVHAYGITNTNLGIVLHNSIATEDTHNEMSLSLTTCLYYNVNSPE